MQNDYGTVSFRAFLESAGVEPEAIRAIECFEAEDDYRAGVKALSESDESFLRFAEGRSPLFALFFFARRAYDPRLEWQRRGIPFFVWRDTFTDLGIWQRVCRRERGILGISETAWLLNHLNLRIFRLGRLQFAPDSVSVGQTVEFSAAGGPSLSLGERFYWVHIPEGESLTREFCDDSFALAAEFFGGRMVFACDSWILSPALRTLFRQDSNLAAFARRFKIVSFCADSRSAERYLFGKIGDPACYSEDTSLQRAAKKYLLEKGALGTGLGIFEYI